jgi:hypothetical protein
VQAGQPTLFWEAWPKHELSAFSTYAPPMIDAAFGWPFFVEQGMTINTTTNRVSYDGDGSTVEFTVPFAFFGADELEVVERVILTGAETTKTLTTDYTVADGGGTTGMVTAVAPPPSTVS